MTKQERPMRQMDRDLLGAVIVINNDIVSGTREDSAGPLAADLLRKFRVYVSGQIPGGLGVISGEPGAAGTVSQERSEKAIRNSAEASESISSAGSVPSGSGFAGGSGSDGGPGSDGGSGSVPDGSGSVPVGSGSVPVSSISADGSDSDGSRLYHCRETLEDVGAALEAAIAAGARVLVTVGGTGISMGDIAPEATAPLLEVRMDGIAQQIREHGLTVTPLASLSRGLVGITHRSQGGVLIVNAPGSRGGVKDSLAVVCPLFPHIFEQLDDQEV